MEKAADNELDAFYRWRAWARQTLGLTLAEFDRLTPREIEIEIKTAREIRDGQDRERDLTRRLIDTHFAMLETLFYNANFQGGAKVDEFKLLGEAARKISAELAVFDAQVSVRAMENLKKKRAKNGGH